MNRFTQAWQIVDAANCPNLGIGLDSFHIFAAKDNLDDLDLLDPQRVFLVQLSDFMWQETPTFEERMTTARTFRVFPGEGVHSEVVAPAGCSGLSATLRCEAAHVLLPLP